MRSLLRNIGAAVAGYLVLFAVAFVLFSLTWLALGADRLFEAGRWDVSGAWIAVSIVLGLIANMAGGFSCSKLGASRHAPFILVVLVAAGSALSGIPDGAAVGVRPDAVSMFDAMNSLQQPVWLLWLNPVFGVIGVVLGAGLETRASA